MMIVDREQILQDTDNAFNSTPQQKEAVSKLEERVGIVPEKAYKALYTAPLVPTGIKLDVELFNFEIRKYDNWFEQWGHTMDYLPRKAIALVNEDGHIKTDDPVNKSLYEYNVDNPSDPKFDCDFRKATEILDLPSLEPLNIFDPYWCRSNILKWEEGGKFVPHIDCTLDKVHWLRLWGTTTNNLRLRFDIHGDGELIEHEDVECGQIYLIDTSLIHDARCIKGTSHQFFLAVLPKAYHLLADLASN